MLSTYIFSSRFIMSLMIGLIAGLFLGLIDQLSDGLILEVIVLDSCSDCSNIDPEFYEPINGLWGGLEFGFAVGLPAGIFISLVEALRLRLTPKPSKRQRKACLTIVVIGLSFLSFCFVSLFWFGPQKTLFARIDTMTFQLMELVILGLLYGGIFGFRGRNQSLITDIRTVEVLGWSLPKGFRGALIGVGVVIIIGLLLGIIGTQRGQVLDETRVMYVALSFWGPLGGVIGFLFGGLSNQTLETQSMAGRGIKLSARNGVYAGLLVASLGGIAGALSGALPFGLTGWLPFGLSAGISYGICFGLLAFLWYGGFDIIQHYMLRLILIIQGYTPHNYVRFLDYATERIFLRKVGGGYIFVHRLLMEHFAEMEPEQSLESTNL
jgi:hypothetical protein